MEFNPYLDKTEEALMTTTLSISAYRMNV